MAGRAVRPTTPNRRPWSCLCEHVEGILAIVLQSLTVRPVLDSDGQETGLFDVPVGGRRFRALELLMAQKPMNFADYAQPAMHP